MTLPIFKPAPVQYQEITQITQIKTAPVSTSYYELNTVHFYIIIKDHFYILPCFILATALHYFQIL